MWRRRPPARRPRADAPVSDAVTVFVRPGAPASEATLRYPDQRGVAYTKRDVLSDPSATAILFGRLGKVVVPVVQVGERLLVGHDPVQLARFLPRDESEEQHVAFGASVRTVTSEIASAKGLPAVYGVEVGQVKPDSPAEEAGIQPGDVITILVSRGSGTNSRELELELTVGEGL